MSYILDALKKSDQERKQGEIPSLQTVHADQLSAQHKRSVMRRKVVLLLGFVCLVVLAVGLWQWPAGPAPQVAHQPQPPPKERIVPLAEQEIQPPVQPLVQNGAPEVTGPGQKVAQQVNEPIQKEIPPEPQNPTDTPVIQPEVVIQPAPLLQPEQASAPPLPKAASEPGSSLPLLKELSVDRQKTIPEITLAGHVYADEPSRRMIMINNRIAREGEMVGENLRLVRITWDGVILRHIDTEFQMKLQ